ncbi:hypothetical protein [Blastococcus sp. PRF04-17]|uniref:hypothetical protein n=1 Tax=Blastococcus sp. PRF04-17 TaxID=2933797 RepID=UPI001FF3DA38|nr:hypothetical protein [Blastococcus sp. PRF04-17]UOX99772.1 hypothetical protein MVA48_11995 [Blastococcus sp. PRF04-17]
MTEAESDPERVHKAGLRARELAATYDWDDVAAGYEQLAQRLVAGDVPARRPSGRRSASVPPATGGPVASSASLTGRS